MAETDLTGREPAVPFKGKRAFSSLGCGHNELHELVALAARHSIPCAELRTLGGTVDLPRYLAASYGSPDRLARFMASSPLRVVSLGTSLRLVGNTGESRNALLQYVPWAEACGASTLRVFDGGTTGDREEIAQARATLDWWRERRDGEGWQVDLAIETHDACANEAPLLRLIEALPDCQILWDAHHTWRKGGTHPIDTWWRIRERVRHIHVKDSVGDREAPAGYRYVLPGDGQFPMRELMSALCADGYDGVLSLEWERHWHPQLPTLEEALNAARQHAWW
ncbi:sugar phosphate isomerase/epimerase family protein [Paraburkholderia pallida]|uniref:Sugar phosphate isomerase/epimerase n=1 Tax=Paraburkholderia pallida TaxID=2547399 RepID=A0A4P7D5M9_9BURK|nr:sugar phosphate isomerase/epimerase [Paraburkholderia pallida]QBR03388.1 sugar phosphate isomerase/epimerase [Paraburkholderia pallida]